MSELYKQLIGQVSDDTRAAIIEGDTTWTLGAFKEKINRLASALSTQGVSPGDRVALMFMNQKEFFLGLFALRRLGAVPVPINIQMPPDDIAYVMMNAGCRLVLTTETFAPKFDGKPIPILVSNQTEKKYPSLEEAVEKGDPNFTPSQDHDSKGLHLLMYTSGTTGKPKGVMLSEENLLANLQGIKPVLQFQPQDKILLALPLFHAYGLMIGLVALNAGSPIALVPNFAPKSIIQTIAAQKITILPLVPTMFTVLLKGAKRAGAEAFQSLNYCISGGASLPAELLKQIESTLDLVVLEGYGLTETAPVLSVNNPDRGSIPGSVGRPLNNVDVKLVNDNGEALPWTEGEQSAEGEILVRGENVMQGYYNLPDETKAVFDEDGYFKTGDLGHLDAEGNLVISGGRKKDLIIKAGENISPLRIESTLYEHPAIAEASVIGVPDDKLGEDILACVERVDGETLTEQDVKAFCNERLTPFLTPGQVQFFDELPKSPTGKILKRSLRDQVLADRPTPSPSVM